MRRRVAVMLVLGTLVGAGSARAQVTVTNGDSACADFAAYWTQDVRQQFGAGLTAENVMALAPCAQDATGAWFEPNGPDDPRLPGGGVLSAVEGARVTGVRGRLDGQLTAFEEGLRQLPDPLSRAGSLADALNQHWLAGYWYFPDSHSISDQTDGMLPYGVRQEYWQAMLQFMQDPNHALFAGYVRWWGSRRQAAFPLAVSQQLDPFAQPALRKWLRLDDPPLPWELRDDYTEALFFKSALANGYVR